jgi:hypothetical protein
MLDVRRNMEEAALLPGVIRKLDEVSVLLKISYWHPVVGRLQMFRFSFT